MIRKVILSTDNNIEYLSLLPLAAYSWNKLGYMPVVLTVNVSEANLRVLQQYCVGCDLRAVAPVEGVKDSTVAQLSRLFQGYDSDDILISSDADMVIARDIFLPTLSTDQIVSYGFDLTGKSELPICYIQSTARKWKDLIGEYTVPQSAYSNDWNLFWSTDQQLLTQRACEYGMEKITFVDRLHNHPRGLPTGRWDRACWDVIPNEVIDVHMKRNDFDAQLQVFKHLWPNDDYSFLINFNNAIRSINFPG